MIVYNWKNRNFENLYIKNAGNLKVSIIFLKLSIKLCFMLNWILSKHGPICNGYRSYITIIKELSGNKHREASEQSYHGLQSLHSFF